MQTLTVEFENDRDLYQCFMPFIKQGGLFIHTTQSYKMDAEIKLEVSLPDALESSTVTGRICWVTPVGSQSGTAPGIGVCFIEDPDNIRNQIEKTLGARLNSDDVTLTM